MSQKNVDIPGIGPVVLAKRRGSRSLRLSISADGRVRVGMPTWTPYSVAISFAKSRQIWINEQRLNHQKNALEEGDLIGKAHRLHFYNLESLSPAVKTRLTSTTIEIKSKLPFDDAKVQLKTLQTCERALKAESLALLPPRLADLASRHGYSYSSVSIKKLTSRWGSCSSQKNISLSIFLIQLPWPLIDYVLLHELAHTKHLHHGKDFWLALLGTLPTAKDAKKQIKNYKPAVQPG